MTEVLMTDTFWAFIGLVLFLALVGYFKVPNLVIRSLDERAKRIKDELDEALRLREEAQELLAEYQRKRSEAEQDAQEIIAAAEHKVEAIIAEARMEVEKYIKNRNKLAEQKIAQAESEAIRMVSLSSIDLAISAAREIMAKELDSEKMDLLIQKTLIKMKAHPH